tara:strand:- start:4118 stop:4477 length:360 start_codon:yes stop_codon:yes gene_type:complete
MRGAVARALSVVRIRRPAPLSLKKRKAPGVTVRAAAVLLSVMSVSLLVYCVAAACLLHGHAPRGAPAPLLGAAPVGRALPAPVGRALPAPVLVADAPPKRPPRRSTNTLPDSFFEGSFL